MPSSHSDSTPDGSILPLLADAENRQLLTEWMEKQYDIVAPEPDSIHEAAFDLCIVDDQALAAHQQALAERKEREAPSFLPYLLVTRQQDTETITPEVQNAVDEILTVPTTKAELTWRVGNLVSRRNLSRELKQSDERFQLLFQSVPDPVVVVSSEGVILNSNTAFNRKFEFAESELDRVKFTDLGFVSEGTDEDSGAEQTTHTLYWNQNEGDTLALELNISPVELDEDLVEWIGVFRDITKSKKRIDELEQNHTRLKGLHWSRR